MPVPYVRLTTGFLLVVPLLCPFRVQLQPRQQTTDETAVAARANFDDLFPRGYELGGSAPAYRTPIEAGELATTGPRQNPDATQGVEAAANTGIGHGESTVLDPTTQKELNK